MCARLPRSWWTAGYSATHRRRGWKPTAATARGRVLQVAPIRYQAGKFGSGFKSRPKSPAAIRPVPLAPQVIEAIRRQLPGGSDPDDLVFTVPGTDREPLSRHLLKHVYQKAAHKLTDPAMELPSTARRVLAALRAEGPLMPDQLAERFSTPGGKRRAAPTEVALDMLTSAGLPLPTTHGDGPMRWSATEADQTRRFAVPALRCPHGLRHPSASWLEDAAIPSRVIDEVMGHAGGRHLEQGSRMGRVYRETTPEMVARIVAAVETRLAVVLEVAQRASLESDAGRR